jgi:hypothetical protein
LVRKTKPEQLVSLGPSDARTAAANIGLLAQILAACKLPIRGSASHMYSHADTLHVIIFPVVARLPHISPSPQHA